MDYKERQDLLDEAEPLVGALQNAIKTHTTLEQARNNFKGYSFDYFHRHEIEAARNSAIELVYQIKNLIKNNSC